MLDVVADVYFMDKTVFVGDIEMGAVALDSCQPAFLVVNLADYYCGLSDGVAGVLCEGVVEDE